MDVTLTSPIAQLPPQPFYSNDDLVRMLGLSRGTLRSATRAGLLRQTRLSAKRIAFASGDVVAYLAKLNPERAGV